MPIPMSDYALPKWIRLRDRYTVAGIENQKARFSEIVHDTANDKRKYKHGIWLQAGYNPNHDSTRIENIKLDSDDVTLKGY